MTKGYKHGCENMTDKLTGRARNHTGLKQKADLPMPKIKRNTSKRQVAIQFSKDNLDS